MSSTRISSNKILVSINYEASKGGIARVARLMAEAISFDLVLSLYGNLQEEKVRYHNNNSIKFLLDFLLTFYTRVPSLLVFDHIGPASLLAFIPDFCLKRKKIVVFLHDEEAWRKVTIRHARGLKKATHILCNSDYTYQKFILHNPEFKTKTQVCLLAGVPSSFLARNSEILPLKYESWFQAKDPYCVFVSRLWLEHRYKGYFELLDAFNLYYKQNTRPGLRLAIIGNGNDVVNIRQYIDDNNLHGAVAVFTEISDDELIHFYKRSIGLVFPSIREGFGFVFLEAMYFKKPCIGIKNQPAEEIIVSGKTGMLIEDNTPASILTVIKDIEIFPEKYRDFGLAGKQLFEQKFMNKHFTARFLSCIGEYQM